MRPLWNTKDRYIHNIFIPANFLQIRNDDGSKRYFAAVYPDYAVVDACVNCHITRWSCA